MELASWGRHHEGGIMKEASWRRHHGGGSIVEDASWRHLEASGGIWEASGRHLGGIWEASGRHLGGIWGFWGIWGIWKHLEQFVGRRLQPTAKSSRKCQFHEVFLRVGVTKHCKLQGKMLAGSANGFRQTSRALYQHRKNPYSYKLFGEQQQARK